LFKEPVCDLKKFNTQGYFRERIMFYDMPLDQLQTYKPDREEPDDFDDFWRDTLLEAREFPLDLKIKKMDFGLDVFETLDVSFCGFGGQKINLHLSWIRGGREAIFFMVIRRIIVAVILPMFQAL
jgi:hypothetical protein